MEMRTNTPRLTAHGPHSPRIVGLSLHAGASMRSIGDPTAMNTVTTAASRRREGGASGSHQWSMVHGASAIVHRPSSIVHRQWGSIECPCLGNVEEKHLHSSCLSVGTFLHYCCRWEVLPVLT